MPQGSAPIPALISSGVFLSVLMFQTRCKSLTACQIGRATLASRVQPNQNGGGGVGGVLGGCAKHPGVHLLAGRAGMSRTLSFCNPPHLGKDPNV